MEIWHIWIIAAIVLLIVEVFAPTFLASCIALGCISAGFISFLDFGLKSQLILFSIGTAIGFFAVRPFMLKYAHKNSITLKTNTGALVGKEARVSETIDSEKNKGRVIVDGEDWKAESENSEPIDCGTKVQIVSVNSTILIVKQTINI